MRANPNFLQEPITEQQLESGAGPAMVWGCSSVQGWRSHMEDEHLVVCELDGFPGCSLFAVFDGHAGKAAAIYSRQHLRKHVSAALEGVPLDTTGSDAAVTRALTQAFFDLDAALSVVGLDCGGTTCTSVFVTPTTFYFTNLGDSRTVLNRGSKLAYQTRDHKPYSQHERNRIKDAGGFVLNGRVDGGLAVSRAFGDFIYKQRPDLHASDQKVSPEPTIDAIPRDIEKDNFLMLCCDGVWDVMSSESGSKFVNSRLKKAEKRTPEGVELTCMQLVDRTLNLGSRDNVSVLIICYDRPVKDKGKKKKAADGKSGGSAPTTPAKGAESDGDGGDGTGGG